MLRNVKLQIGVGGFDRRGVVKGFFLNNDLVRESVIYGKPDSHRVRPLGL